MNGGQGDDVDSPRAAAVLPGLEQGREETLAQAVEQQREEDNEGGVQQERGGFQFQQDCTQGASPGTQGAEGAEAPFSNGGGGEGGDLRTGKRKSQSQHDLKFETALKKMREVSAENGEEIMVVRDKSSALERKLEAYSTRAFEGLVDNAYIHKACFRELMNADQDERHWVSNRAETIVENLGYMMRLEVAKMLAAGLGVHSKSAASHFYGSRWSDLRGKGINWALDEGHINLNTMRAACASSSDALPSHEALGALLEAAREGLSFEALKTVLALHCRSDDDVSAQSGPRPGLRVVRRTALEFFFESSTSSINVAHEAPYRQPDSLRTFGLNVDEESAYRARHRIGDVDLLALGWEKEQLSVKRNLHFFAADLYNVMASYLESRGYFVVESNFALLNFHDCATVLFGRSAFRYANLSSELQRYARHCLKPLMPTQGCTQEARPRGQTQRRGPSHGGGSAPVQEQRGTQLPGGSVQEQSSSGQQPCVGISGSGPSRLLVDSSGTVFSNTTEEGLSGDMLVLIASADTNSAREMKKLQSVTSTDISATLVAHKKHVENKANPSNCALLSMHMLFSVFAVSVLSSNSAQCLLSAQLQQPTQERETIRPGCGAFCVRCTMCSSKLRRRSSCRPSAPRPTAATTASSKRLLRSLKMSRLTS